MRLALVVGAIAVSTTALQFPSYTLPRRGLLVTNRLRWFVRQLIPLTHDFSSFHRSYRGGETDGGPLAPVRSWCTVAKCFPLFALRSRFVTVHRVSRKRNINFARWKLTISRRPLKFRFQVQQSDIWNFSDLEKRGKICNIMCIKLWGKNR